MNNPEFIQPDWPLSGRVGALVTTRVGGVSQQPWASLNLGSNTQDDPFSVAKNREILAGALGSGIEPCWLKQVHGTRVVGASSQVAEPIEADACYVDRPGIACAVLTADCLPVFLGNEEATEVAVVHAGWRGLAAGVIGETLKKFNSAPADIHAWLGPAISADHYEVGEDVRKAFAESAVFVSLPVAQAFSPKPDGKWAADLYELARMQLRSLGVRSTSGGDRCTYREKDYFYSYRRDGETGRFASLIWLKK
jgi:YfiH family protein